MSVEARVRRVDHRIVGFDVAVDGAAMSVACPRPCRRRTGPACPRCRASPPGPLSSPPLAASCTRSEGIPAPSVRAAAHVVAVHEQAMGLARRSLKPAGIDGAAKICESPVPRLLWMRIVFAAASGRRFGSSLARRTISVSELASTGAKPAQANDSCCCCPRQPRRDRSSSCCRSYRALGPLDGRWSRPVTDVGVAA